MVIVDIVGGVGLSRGFGGGATGEGNSFKKEAAGDGCVDNGLLTCSAVRDNAVDSGMVLVVSNGFRVMAHKRARGTGGFLAGFSGDRLGHLS